jgi:hypothetical protein
MIHPWRTTKVPDVGKFLYKHVHSLHHKAYNPTALSGVRMHPVESALYFSAALIPVAFGAHPVPGFSYCLIDMTIGALLGHGEKLSKVVRLLAADSLLFFKMDSDRKRARDRFLTTFITRITK